MAVLRLLIQIGSGRTCRQEPDHSAVGMVVARAAALEGLPRPGHVHQESDSALSRLLDQCPKFN